MKIKCQYLSFILFALNDFYPAVLILYDPKTYSHDGSTALRILHKPSMQKNTGKVVENNRVEYVFRSYKIRACVFGSLSEVKSKKNYAL